jgi:hypothetical protein
MLTFTLTRSYIHTHTHTKGNFSIDMNEIVLIKTLIIIKIQLIEGMILMNKHSLTHKHTKRYCNFLWIFETPFRNDRCSMNERASRVQ